MAGPMGLRAKACLTEGRVGPLLTRRQHERDWLESPQRIALQIERFGTGKVNFRNIWLKQ